MIFSNNKDLDQNILKGLKSMLDANNVHAQAFRMVRDLFKKCHVQDVRLKTYIR